MKRITLTLRAKDMSNYNPKKKAWVLEKDDYKILLGKSSRKIELKDLIIVW